MILFRGFLGPRRISFSVLFFAAVLLSVPLFLPTNVHSAQVTLAWDANTEPGIAGYKIYYGTSSRSYPNKVDAGNRTTWTVTNLQENLTYYFAATAYSSGGEESAFSTEVVYNTSPPPPPACTYSISPSSQSISTSGGPGTVTVTTGSACPWTVVSNVSWIIPTSNSSVKGTGTENYSVSANSGSSSRTGTLTIAGQTLTVSQSGTANYAITASAGSGGSISPSGAVNIAAGGSKTFTIAPSSGYQVSSVLVDGTNKGALTAYTFTNVTANHTISVSFSPSTGSVVFAVNSGGSQYTYSDGTVYRSDRYYSGGSTWNTTASISGTTNDPLYQSERYGNFSYSIPLPNGNYTVLLRFAEIYWSAPGKRLFDVYIQGTKVISRLDIFALVGKNADYSISFPTTVANGTLNIRFSTIANNAKVSAILVRTR